ncbi:MAG: hypothetical protein MJ065_09785, partial [Oscillospiraceae bacterium]|nr:hypothetical protein [Oscillospiraceae bacterium]
RDWIKQIDESDEMERGEIMRRKNSFQHPETIKAIKRSKPSKLSNPSKPDKQSNPSKPEQNAA